MQPRELVAAAALVAMTASVACGDDTVTPPVEEEKHTWQDCQGSDQAFVRRALMAVGGRRAWNTAELVAYTTHLQALRDAGMADVDARHALVRTMFLDTAYRMHWSEAIMDGLSVRRNEVIRSNSYVEIQTQSCYGNPSEIPIDAGELAQWVRDNSPDASDPPVRNFTLGQLLNSALTLDDVTPLYRGHLFQLMAFPLSGANVDELELERVRRSDIGETFEATYLNRNLVCLECHNQDESVTVIYPLPGNFDRALYRSANARAVDHDSYHAMFRVMDVVVEEGTPPWQWSEARCGVFARPTSPDPLGVASSFGNLDPDHATIWSLEASLHRGFAALTDPAAAKSAANPDPDQALAYLVSRSFVEIVWAEIFGSELTIAHHFPRTEVQRDTLDQLTDQFITSRYSLKSLILSVIDHPAFNLAPPAEGCGESANELPPLFDPWVEPDEAGVQYNGLSDLVRPLGARTLLRNLHRSMNWVPPAAIPSGDELRLQKSLGAFLSLSERGFDGLDLVGQLSWEHAYTRCDRFGVTADFIDHLGQSIAAQPGATLGDAIVALKDRLVNEPTLSETERVQLEQLLGASLAAPPPADVADKLRTACGVYVATPQFLLDGAPPPDSSISPVVLDQEHSYAATCADIAKRLGAQGIQSTVNCDVPPQ